MWKYYSFIFSLIVLLGCINTANNILQIHITNSNPQKVYLYQTASFENDPILIDSISNNSLDTKIKFKIPPADQKIYQLIVSPYLPSIYFVNDTSQIEIDVDLNDFVNYKIKSGVINKDFIKLNKQIFPKLNQLSNSKITDLDSKNILSEIDSLYLDLAKNTNFPEVALFAASNLNFDGDVEKMKPLIQSFKSRFASDKALKRYIYQSEKFIDTKTKEFNLGDSLPNLKFRDIITGQNISTFTKNKNIIIYDFFSVLQRNDTELTDLREVIRKYGQDNVKIYSFPVDPDSVLIQQYIKNSKVDWPHFSDYQGWQGEIIPKYYIDSVPYLFVTDNNGLVIHKNITIKRLFEKVKK